MFKEFFLKVRRKLFLNAIQGLLLEERKCSLDGIDRELKRMQDENRFYKNLSSKFLSAAYINKEAFLPFKNYCRGKKLVLCGAGPSLAHFRPLDNAVYIALNRAFLFDKVNFDFIFSQDWDGIRFVSDEVRDYRKGDCVKLFAHQYAPCDWVFQKNVPESFVSACGGKRFCTDIFTFYNSVSYEDLCGCEFVVDIDSRPIGNFPNVALSAVQFALYMNPAKLYIVGIDCHGGHFTTQNMSEIEAVKDKEATSYRWVEQGDGLKLLWERAKHFAAVYYPDTEIISVNPVGLKGIFKDWYQDAGSGSGGPV